MPLPNFAEPIEELEQLDEVAEAIAKGVAPLLGPDSIKGLLEGRWLGHPLHPLLTDLPIGFWGNAWVFDLFGGKRAQVAADALIAGGLITALPTILSGLAEFMRLGGETRRVATVHGLTNVTATIFYLWSYIERKRGKRLRGILVSQVGAALATGAAYLGGHMVFRRGAGQRG